jgi:stage IV sporulation protein FB
MNDLSNKKPRPVVAPRTATTGRGFLLDVLTSFSGEMTMLGEPPRSQFDLNFSLLGIPIRVHPLFWLVALILGSNRQDVASVFTWIIAVFLGIMVHELGHALAMRAYGFYPWITLYGMGGLTSHDHGHGYNSQGSGPLGQILTCLAGPVAGFLLAAIVMAGIHWTGGPTNPRLADLIGSLLFICIIWGIVNLLPIYPLDGGQIARELLLLISSRNGIVYSLMLSIVIAVGMAAAGFLLWRSFFVALLFGYLAFTNYMTLQVYRGRPPW